MIDVWLAGSAADFAQARVLIEEMGAWDAAEVRSRGLDSAGIVDLYYSDSTERLRAKFTQPGSAFYLCGQAGAAAGCVGFTGVGDGVCELQKLFVRPGLRGFGAGRALMREALAGMARDGYRRARLETVTFMTEALALYRASGFSDCPPFHEPPEGLLPITVFMERGL